MFLRVFYLRLITTPELFRSSYLGCWGYISGYTIIHILNCGIQKIYLNTTASGAGVTEDVKDFHFSGLSGAHLICRHGLMVKIRFSEKDSTHIAHEIEQWDAVKKRAAVWVSAMVW